MLAFVQAVGHEKNTTLVKSNGHEGLEVLVYFLFNQIVCVWG